MALLRSEEIELSTDLRSSWKKNPANELIVPDNPPDPQDIIHMKNMLYV
jgi:hypothetical protein